MTRFLLVLNDSAEDGRSSTGLRMAVSLAKREKTDVRVFLMGEAVSCAKATQKTSKEHQKLTRMMTVIDRQGGQVVCCSTCMDAHGISDAEIIESVRRAPLEELTDWTLDADKVLVF